VVKIADFGISLQLTDTEKPPSKPCGTLAYMAPEMLNIKKSTKGTKNERTEKPYD